MYKTILISLCALVLCLLSQPAELEGRKYASYSRTAKSTNQYVTNSKPYLNPNKRFPLQIQKKNGVDILDSHGLTHKQAKEQINRYMKTKRDNRSFVVITGKGNHGNHPRFKMKNEVRNEIENKHRRWNVINDPKNSGRLIINRG